MLRYLLRIFASKCCAIVHKAYRDVLTKLRKHSASQMLCFTNFYMVRKSPKIRREVEHFTARPSVLPFDDDAAAHTAEIRADLEHRGCMIGPYDLMIAGHARSRGLVVVTGNLREFTRVNGLRSENWMAD